jgi:dTDP-glucose pyrophosphorylase/CBS domain-containing protein
VTYSLSGIEFVESISIDRGRTFLQGIHQLNELNSYILLVVDADGRMVGTVTDGDIRKAISSGVPFSDPIDKVCNRNYKYLKTRDDDAALGFFEDYGIRRIPVIDDGGRVIDIMLIEDALARSDLKHRERKVVVMAGGKGSRLDPITRVVPKPLLPLGDRPVIEHIMDSFHEQGYRDFVISVNYKKDYIKSYFSEKPDMPYRVSYVEEESFMGTAGSLSLMKDILTETFFLTNCDILVDMSYRSAYREHVKQRNAITVVGVLKNINVPYGVITIKDGEFVYIDEKPDYHFVVNAGVYIIEPECLDLIDVNGAGNGLFHMTDLIKRTHAGGMKIGVFPAHRKWVDIGQWNDYNKLV